MESAFQQIINWVKARLPLWAQDAFRRIYENSNGDLSNDDIAEVTELLKKTRGISKTEAEPRPPIDPVAPTQPRSEFVFKSIGQLKNVNAIVENSVLRFQPSGLTVIYGDNGSGKSGYTRMLKGACYARYQKEEIHPNIYAETPSGVPSAIFEWKDGDKNSSHKWSVGETPLEVLRSSVAVFDSKCARIHVDDNNKFRIALYGVEMLKKLSTGFDRIREKLKGEQSAINVADVDNFASSKMDGTPSGYFLDKLRQAAAQDQTVEELKKIANSFSALVDLSDSERDRLGALRKDLNALDPAQAANELDKFRVRLEKLRNAILGAGKLLSEQAVVSAQKEFTSFCAAKDETNLSKRQRDAYLNGTGEDYWRTLLSAASEFSRKSAYRNEVFPFVENGAQCVLCQQPLSSQGGDNLRAFAEFLTRKVEENCQKAKKVLDARERQINEVAFDFWNESLDAEIEKHCGDSLRMKIKEHIDSLRNRKSRIIPAMKSGDWGVIAPVSHCQIDDDIGEMLDNINQRILSLRGDLKSRAANVAEYRNLASRADLCGKQDAVKKIIAQLKKKALLRECEREADTAKISNFVGRLVQTTHTNDLKKRLREECEALGISRLPITFGDGEMKKGEPHNRLDFSVSSARKRKIGISKILSEGEDRAIAIAAFLAEVGIYNAVRCIVFDDPVSSLDHQHREAVAERLIEEAKNRQVIVFTHDLVFTHFLHDHARAVVNYHRITVWNDVESTGTAGIVGDPDFEHMTIKEMIRHLKNECQRATKISPAEKREIVRSAYMKLRLAVDALVERKVLRETVVRFSGRVRVGNIPRVFSLVDPLTVSRKITDLFSKCADRVAHLSASAANPTLPSIEELKNDIDLFESIRAALDPPKKK